MNIAIMELGQEVQQLVPHLWHLVGCLLDVGPDCHCTAPAEIVVDEDIEMELPDIAIAVEGNDKGSERVRCSVATFEPMFFQKIRLLCEVNLVEL